MKSDIVRNTTEQRLTVRCPAKLNLTFSITGDLPDGYHSVETLLQAINLEDELTFDFADAESFDITIQIQDSIHKTDFPLDGSNLIAKAAKLYVETVKELEKVKISVNINKKIPIAAGLAGGSANAAATLVALNTYAGGKLPESELLELASQLGADVPFSLVGGRRLGTYKGDQLSQHYDGERLNFVIIKPRHLGVATAWVYKTYDEMNNAGEIYPPDLDASEILAFLQQGEFDKAASGFGNVFEQVVFPHHRDLLKIRKQVLELGAWCCHLTGSGPTLYALVANNEMAHMVRREMLTAETILCASGTCGAKYDLLDVWIAESVDYGATVINEKRS